MADSLSDGERQELDQARAADPSIDVELEELRGIMGRLDKAEVTWREESLPAGLEARILAETVLADEAAGDEPGTTAPPSSSGRAGLEERSQDPIGSESRRRSTAARRSRSSGF
ncbi:hypothetical protein [Nesterenkonia sp. CF4.4]|uniref:hypothetical protein n=1 Tax=Nesterenkonia sp. CF4.4 TaxID=3373079 RepID=UPI003EE463FE